MRKLRKVTCQCSRLFQLTYQAKKKAHSAYVQISCVFQTMKS